MLFSQAVPKVRPNHILGFVGFSAQLLIIVKRFKSVVFVTVVVTAVMLDYNLQIQFTDYEQVTWGVFSLEAKISCQDLSSVSYFR